MHRCLGLSEPDCLWRKVKLKEEHSDRAEFVDSGQQDHQRWERVLTGNTRGSDVGDDGRPHLRVRWHGPTRQVVREDDLGVRYGEGVLVRFGDGLPPLRLQQLPHGRSFSQSRDDILATRRQSVAVRDPPESAHVGVRRD